MPAEASTAAVPERWRTQWHVRRYGFHGLSVQWASEQVRVKRLVVCHLGGGCSVSAVLDGRSVDTTMGFSPLEGVAMATRSGSLDPAAILYLLRRGAGGADEIEQVLERESGLLGLSGLSCGSGGSRALGRAGRAAGARRLLLSHRQCDRGDVRGAGRARRDRLQRRRGGGLRARPGTRVRAPRLPRRRARATSSTPLPRPTPRLTAAGSAVRVVVVRAREDVVAARAVRDVLAATS